MENTAKTKSRNYLLKALPIDENHHPESDFNKRINSYNVTIGDLEAEWNKYSNFFSDHRNPSAEPDHDLPEVSETRERVVILSETAQENFMEIDGNFRTRNALAPDSPQTTLGDALKEAKRDLEYANMLSRASMLTPAALIWTRMSLAEKFAKHG
jgi:hypothetical protein